MPLPFKTPLSPGGPISSETIPRLDESSPGLGSSDCRYLQFERESSGGIPDDPGAALPVLNPAPYKKLRGG